MKYKLTPSEALARLPGPRTPDWPDGEFFVTLMAHGTMSVEYYAPRGADPQTPHDQDELYFIHTGRGELRIAGERFAFSAGDCFFVPARVEHRVETFSPDFGTWVVFWGPQGGEA
ncbi:MAG: cupin domain-containing protein [Gammaproteobacteria bacterium]|nr:cupin domain-containing protein [Gammaproteobacteria bacterium]